MRIRSVATAAAVVLACASATAAHAVDIKINVSFLNQTSGPAIAYVQHGSDQQHVNTTLMPNQPAFHTINRYTAVDGPEGRYGIGLQLYSVATCYMEIVAKRTQGPVQGDVTCTIEREYSESTACSFAAMAISASECAATIVAK
ncbi:hypothetical protein EDC65_0265 [Stella humosa]|uniref:Uncharacterized protein n=1 Tax=Stella humosa TaxID=94 RepID=A0A3N1MED5_9PROT|nr:hypothetical protein [Stella humosa]ROQ01090.1 hypothetical protein EDC65_0265 [Stella humosa]BBK31462.1 hypothetical protein STHU_20960 [Stella humosa]